MGYYIDLEKLTLESYRKKLKNAYLPPSRMMLKEKLEERFTFFESIGVKNVKELIQLLKKKEKLSELAKAECLSEAYLTIMLRELNSTLPKPNKIAEFSIVSKETAEKLEHIGVKNTFQLFDLVLNKTDRKKLSDTTGINENDILELAKLTDLSRIKWVGVTFAVILYEMGIDTVEKVSKTDPVDLHQKLIQINSEKKIFKGQIGLNDIKILVEAAKEVPLEIAF
jgi:hypothetical protein